jgi:hypothetical protein
VLNVFLAQLEACVAAQSVLNMKLAECIQQMVINWTFQDQNDLFSGFEKHF